MSSMSAPPAGVNPKHLLLRYPIFGFIWAGAFVSNIGNWMENSAQSWAVVSQLTKDPTRAAFMSEVLNFADFAPALMLLLIAGVITDRVRLKRYLLMLQIAACGMGSALAVVAWLGWASPWVVVAFTFAEGVIWALNGPPWQTVVPHLVPREEVPKAIALNSAQFNLARLMGPMIAGALIYHYGVAMAFTLNGLSFVVVIFALTKLPSDRAKPQAAAAHSISHDLFVGLRFVAGHPGLRRLSIMLLMFVFFGAPLQGLLAVYAQQVLHGNPLLFGLLLGAMGLGALGGALAVGRVPAYYPRHHLIPLSMTLAAVLMFAFSFAANPWINGALLVGIGFFWVISLNSSNSANQLLAQEENRGRVMSVMLLCTMGAMPLGHLAGAALIRFMPAPLVIRSMSGTLLVVSLFFVRHREPAIDRMERRDLKLGWAEWFWETLTAQSHRRVPVDVRREIAASQSASAQPEGRSAAG